MGNRWGNSGNSVRLYFLGSKITADVTAAMKLKDAYSLDFPGGSEFKVYACNAGELGSIPELGKSSGEGNGTPRQYSCLENPMDGGAWWATVHGVTKSWTQLSDFTFTFTYSLEGKL